MKLVDFFRKKKQAKKVEYEQLPVAGRQTEVVGSTSLLSLVMDSMTTVTGDFPFELIDIIRKLAMYNDDVSYAVDNIVQLGNTPFSISFGDVDDESMLNELNQLNKKLYRGGVNSLINDVIAQTGITGAISVEILLDEFLDGVKGVVSVNTETIRFKYDKEQEKYKVYQQAASGTSDLSLIELNESTFKYIPYRRFNEKPYGIPPFLSALDSIKIENDMICGLKSAIDKIGVLGFLHVLVKPPSRQTGESITDYQTRLRNYLKDSIEPEVEKGFSKGYVIGYEGTHNFNMQSTTPNMSSIDALFNLITTKKHSGLKQDSMMLNRGQNNTTETLGRVLLAKMSQQIKNYQYIVANLLEDIYRLHLLLKGYSVNTIKVKFESPMIGDVSRDEEALGKKIQNLMALYNQGIITQEQLATELGYESPALPEPRTINIVEPVDVDTTDDDIGGKTTEVNIKDLIREFGFDGDEFNYHAGDCNCGTCDTESYSKKKVNPLDVVQRFIDLYFSDITDKYEKSVTRLVNKVGKEILKISDDASLNTVSERVYFLLLKEWGNDYTKYIKPHIKSFLNRFYKALREDKSVFKKYKGDIPDVVFSNADARALAYYKNSDELYLGKFITDSDTRERITRYIKEQYLDKGLPIGNNKTALKRFRQAFSDILVGEEWKMRRIIDTTVNRMRNSAAVNYMQQAEVTQYEIVGVNDSNQCDWCKNLQGKKFTIESAVEKYEKMLAVDPANVGSVVPFTVSVTKPEDLKNMTQEQLQLIGAGILPAHPHCRDAVVAVI